MMWAKGKQSANEQYQTVSHFLPAFDPSLVSGINDDQIPFGNTKL
jgi:hypothetical protein